MAFDQKAASSVLQEIIENLEIGKNPVELYEPIRYILELGGKRLRPVLTLLGCAVFDEGESYQQAVYPALAIEFFHNFTLMHDDIMDNAPLRRGKMTVHEKWNANVAILSGDALLVKAYEMLLPAPAPLLPRLLALFNKTALEVCEGQQFDMNFEAQSAVSIPEYLEMIRLKTAVLLGLSLQMGALIGGADEYQASLLRQFGEDMGIGFQLKDDLLDVYGDQAKFGKQVGGDIIANKKTYLLLRALADAAPEDRAILDYWLSLPEFDIAAKVTSIVAVFDRLDIAVKTKELMQNYFQRAFSLLDQLDLPQERKQTLVEFGKNLAEREN